MKLREMLEKINTILSENMKKEVIQTSDYGYKYDEVNGRKVIHDMNIKSFICEESGIGSLYVNINKAVNLDFLGIKFKLKRKKSGLKSSYDYTDRLTYSEIIINKEFEDKLDIELDQLHIDYRNDIQKEYRKTEERQLSNINKFKDSLKGLNMTVEQFKELREQYELLSYFEKDLLFKK